MQLENLDWCFILGFFVVALLIGVAVTRRAGSSASEFFLSGRNMPWWLLGFSMVATTFSTDTPNLVTDMVRQDGVAGNWTWWAFLLTGMLTVFVYAKLWRRSKVMTDIEFYEVRYSGKPAAFLRGFRALYLGVFFNVIVMGAVTLAAIKIGGVLLGFSPMKTILLASVITVVFSALGGLRAVLFTDFLLFIIAMVGAVAAAVVALRQDQVGGLSGMLSNELLSGKLSIFPEVVESDKWTEAYGPIITLFILPLAVQWWSVWYPGAEPGGGGYLAQRMLSAKNERHAVGATLFFNAAHYALRPWPWILVALCSLIIFPMDSKTDRDGAKATLASPEWKELVKQYEKEAESVTAEERARIEELLITKKGLNSIRKAYPEIEYDKLGHDLAYPAMLTFLPAGFLGLVLASLIAAYMSTISTHLNWGSSYVVNDFWKRFVKPDAGEKELVWVGRVSTVVLMVLAGALALWLSNAFQAFKILLQIGAGTGLLFILRWFWWRINALCELTAMLVSFAVALFFEFAPFDWVADLTNYEKLPLGVAFTTICWLVVAYLSRPTEDGKLRSFYRLVKPGGPGWRVVLERARADGDTLEGESEGWSVPAGILCMVVGCLAVYSFLFSVGYFLYGRMGLGVGLAVVAVVSTLYLVKAWNKVIGK